MTMLDAAHFSHAQPSTLYKLIIQTDVELLTAAIEI